DKLNFGDYIFGRSEQLETLLRQAVMIRNEVGRQINRLLLIAGESGSGKSYLVQRTAETLAPSGWRFISAKFDRLQRQPFSVVVSSFDAFFRSTLANSHERNYINAVVASLSHHLSVSAIVDLCNLIPILRGMFPNILQREESSRRNRLHYIFRVLLTAISSVERPLMLFLDDLQWCDQNSLDLLTTLSTQQLDGGMEDAGCVMFVGSYRSNEVDANHVLSSYLTNFDRSTAVIVTKLRVDPVSLKDTNKMLSTVLRLPLRLTRYLTIVVHSKTLGNPFHIKAFLQSLVNEKVLTYSLVERRFVWDILAVKAASIHKDIVGFLKRKLLSLPRSVQESLKVISCFGSQVDTDIIEKLHFSETLQSFMEDLKCAVNESILETSGRVYYFTHDSIQQAAYELMSLEEQRECHCYIGSELLKNISASREPTFLFMFDAVDQLNISKAMGVTVPALAQVLSSLNSRAGDRSMEVGDFVTALSYAEFGISYLDESKWTSNYELCLHLYEIGCVSCYVNGQYDKIHLFLDELLENARCLQDMLKGYYVRIQSLGVLGKVSEAIDKSFDIIRQLGQSFPPLEEITPELLHSELASISLDDFSLDEIVAAPKLPDTKKCWIMKYMTNVMTYLVFLRQQYLPLLAVRMIMFSQKYGYCNESAVGLSAYAHAQLHLLRNVDEGFRWSKNAILLLEGFKAKELLPRLMCFHHSHFTFWKEPIQSSCELFLEVHRQGLLIGDVEIASISRANFGIRCFVCGHELTIVEKEFSSHAIDMVQLKQLRHLSLHLPYQQLILKLMGIDKNPYAVSAGVFVDEDSLLQHAVSTKESGLLHTIYFTRLFLAYWFERYEEAAEMAACYRGATAMRFSDVYHALYEGLSAFCLARSSVDEPKWMVLGENAIATYRSWVKHSSWNFENKLLLLEAERFFAKGEIEAAKEKYETSIESARRHRFVHEEGLAMELLGRLYRDSGRLEEAKEQIALAHVCYDKWGAKGVLDRLGASWPEVSIPPIHRHTISLKGPDVIVTSNIFNL
ncbi:THAPSDRAFT_264653, partial [Thalassiosira pseudonana CCMP1335]